MGQSALQKFQEELGQAIKDPYQVVMRQTKLPITLLRESSKFARVHLLETESFENTFGPKKQRKRPSLAIGDLDTYVSTAQKSGDGYEVEKDGALVRDLPDSHDLSREWIMKAGLSKRIWGELYKVIDSSDVIIQVLLALHLWPLYARLIIYCLVLWKVLDARDPMGTRCRQVEAYIRKEKSHKQLFFVLNKVFSFSDTIGRLRVCKQSASVGRSGANMDHTKVGQDTQFRISNHGLPLFDDSSVW